MVEYERQSAQAIRPSFHRYGHRRGRLTVYRGGLHGKIIRRIFGRDFHFLVAPDLNKPFGGLPIGPIGFQPHTLLDGDRNVVEADLLSRREVGAFAANPVIIVQLGFTHAKRNIQVPCLGRCCGRPTLGLPLCCEFPRR